MSRSLPPELLDLIVDHLRNQPATLKACCTVSKSWISSSRKHPFAHIGLRPPKRSVELWKQTFPDPPGSLAHYTHTMPFPQPSSAAFVNPGVVGWICSFRHVEHLFLGVIRDDYGISPVQLHGFSSALRSLSLIHFAIPPSEVFNFVSSFPLLEHLALMMESNSGDTGKWISPSASPKFTRSLQMSRETPSIACWLYGAFARSTYRIKAMRHRWFRAWCRSVLTPWNPSPSLAILRCVCYRIHDLLIPHCRAWRVNVDG